MDNKGFTLIELLAVIVILAIILLIAVPSILNVINDAKEGADTSSAKMILSAGKNYAAIAALDGTAVASTSVACSTLGVDANVPSVTADSGWVATDAADCGVSYDASGDVDGVFYGSAFDDASPTGLDAIY